MKKILVSLLLLTSGMGSIQACPGNPTPSTVCATDLQLTKILLHSAFIASRLALTLGCFKVAEKIEEHEEEDKSLMAVWSIHLLKVAGLVNALACYLNCWL